MQHGSCKMSCDASRSSASALRALFNRGKTNAPFVLTEQQPQQICRKERWSLKFMRDPRFEASSFLSS